jgi:DNA recombination protein RmuC
MSDFILIAVTLLVATCVVMLYLLLTRSRGGDADRLEIVLREELRLDREESSRTASALRQEVSNTQKTSSDTVIKAMEALGGMQKEQLETVSGRIGELTSSNVEQLEKLRGTLDSQLKSLQESNDRKLDQMRATVDEKLQSTLEKRLGESFKLVSSQLEAVQRGLGEMQNLATGVGDLKRVLSNVKTRGTWGEVQLGAILEQILTPDQYETNVCTCKGSSERVEFAIKLPGIEDHPDSVVWLPIDAKFPQEDLQRLMDAADAADAEGVKKARKDLLRTVETSAKEISSKYLSPPQTTDFAIMFLSTESLYAEVLREPGFMEKLQHNYRVTIAGPATLAAFVNSLRMGFRTIAIEKRSSEVWQVLGAVKTEFGKFGEIMTKLHKQLTTARNTIEETQRRTRAMDKELKEVEELPESDTEKMLSLPDDDDPFSDIEQEIEAPLQ